MTSIRIQQSKLCKHQSQTTAHFLTNSRKHENKSNKKYIVVDYYFNNNDVHYKCMNEMQDPSLICLNRRMFYRQLMGFFLLRKLMVNISTDLPKDDYVVVISIPVFIKRFQKYREQRFFNFPRILYSVKTDFRRTYSFPLLLFFV